MTPNENSLPSIGDLVAGRYRIIHELGRGGYGVVFRARQEAINRDVAIKFLLPDVANNPTEVERFRREIFHASSLESRHTITLYDYGKSPAGLFYVVMEFLQGSTLRERINARGAMSDAQAYRLLEQVLESLNEAHRRQLVHRDLKPDNIFLLADGDADLECRVLDFGLSKFIGDPRSTLYRGPSLTADGEVCGTPQYMSPEHAYGETVRPPGDIYSLGLVLYEVLSGKPAFDAPSPLDVLLMQVKEPVPALPAERLDSPLAAFIERATRKDPDQRFEDAGQALHWLYQNPLPSQGQDVDEPPQLLDDRRRVFEETQPQIHGKRGAQPQETTDPSHQISEDLALASPPEKAKEDPTPRQLALERFELRVAQTPLIGRRRSLARLDAWLERATATGGVFAITGDAGTGKSALLHTWCNQLTTRGGLRILRGSQRKNAPALAGLHDAFSNLLQPARRPGSGPIEAGIAARLGQILDASALQASDSDRSISTVLHGLTETLDHLSYQQPVLVVFDDLHLADPISRRFFDHLVDSLTERRRPLAVVVTARHPHQLEGWTRANDEVVTHWALPELSPQHTDELLRRLIPTTDSLSAGVVKLAGGNPALLLHICRYLLESSLIEFDASRSCWALRDPSMSIDELVPLDLQQLIIERADRYLRQAGDEAALRAILHRAVLLGDEFDRALLETVLRAEGLDQLAEKCSSLLAHLAVSGLLREGPSGSSARYAFARPLHRASLVRMVESIDDWRSFHLLVADTMIDADQDERWFDAGRIAEHLERGRAPRRALPWWLRAARQAELEHRFQDALRMVHRALRLQRGRDVDDKLMAQMRLQQGRLSRFLGELGPAEDALREARTYGRRSEESGLHARAGELLAEVILLQGRLDEATAILDEIDALYQVLDDEAGRQRVRLSRADVAIFHGDYGQAKQHYRTLQTTSGADGETAAHARALVGLTRCSYAAGQLQLARSTVDEARHRAREAGNHHIEAAALVEASHIALLTEGVEAAEALAHQALSLARREQDLLTEANAHLALGICLRRSTNIDRARFHSRRARELHESLGHLYGIIKDILLSAEIAWVQGEPERALILAEDTSRLHDELGDRHGWALSALFRSLFLIELGRPEEARTLLAEILAIKGRDELGLYEPQTLFYLGLAFEAERNVEQALQYFSEARTIAEKMGHRELVSLTTINLAKLQLITGDLESARQEIPRALEEAELLGHAYANMFALLGSALLARLDGTPRRLRDFLTRLRTYTVTPYAPQMRLDTRLQAMAALLEQAPDNPRRQAISEALTELADGLQSSP